MALPFSLVVFYYIYRRVVSNISEEAFVQKAQEEFVDYKVLSKKQKSVIIVFVSTVFFWIVPNFLTIIFPNGSKFSLFLKENLAPPTVGIFFASLLFLLPLSGVACPH